MLLAKRDGTWRIGRAAIPLGSALVLLCVLATSWITFDRVRYLLDSKDWVAHTFQVRGLFESIYGKVAAAESDHRAYLLTLDEASHRRYIASEKEVRNEIAEAYRLTSDNPQQGPKLDELGLAVAKRFTYMASSTKERTAHGLDRTIELLQSGEGFRSMDEVRSLITSLDDEEQRLLALRQARSAGQTLQAELAAMFSVALSTVLIVAFGFLSSRLVQIREEAADEERAFRNDLEREIGRTRAAESRLERTLVELRRSNEELQNFAFVASHDLQEPLRKIRAFSDRIRRRSGDKLDDESKDSLLRVEAAADRMQRLILDLLELSRITTKTRPHIRIKPGETIDEVADDLQTRLEETGGEIVYGELPSIVVDPAQLRQLFQNLFANALKFRREGVTPEISVEAQRRDDGRVEFAVHDNGIGFETKYADRIFVVFQRLHGRGEYEGSGIGLAIVRKIVDRHGGQILAEGRPGEGATFRFDLPGEESSVSSEDILTPSREE